MAAEQQDELSELLARLKNDDDQIRLGALHRLMEVPSLAGLDAVKRAAAEDTSSAVRFEARRFIGSMTTRLSGAHTLQGLEAALSFEDDVPAPGPAAFNTSTRLTESVYRRVTFDLQHDSAEVRADTLRRVARTRDPRLLADVRRSLRDPDPAVRHAARHAVRSLLPLAASREPNEEQLKAFDEQLGDTDEKALRAMTAVVKITLLCGTGPTAELLIRHLPSAEHPFLRAQILSSLALFGDSSCLELISSHLYDSDARVRATAVDALELIGDETEIGLLDGCLEDQDPRVRSAALRVLVASGNATALDRLRELLGSEVAADRAAGLHAVRCLEIPERFDLLRDHFRIETEPQLYKASAAALIGAGPGEQLSALAELLSEIDHPDKRASLELALQTLIDAVNPEPPSAPSPEDSVHGTQLPDSFSKIIDLEAAGNLQAETIRRTLAREKDPISISTLLLAAAGLQLPDTLDLAQPHLLSRDRRVRMAVVQALEKLNSEDAGECIARLVRDPDEQVSNRALDALGRLRPEAALASIKALIDSGQSGAVVRGLELLENLGDPSSLPMVLKVLEKGPSADSVQVLSRLMTAWGTRSTLEQMQQMLQRSPKNRRPFLAELSEVLAAKLESEPAPPKEPARPEPRDRDTKPQEPSRRETASSGDPTATTVNLPRPVQASRPSTSPAARIDIDSRQLAAAAVGLLVLAVVVIGMLLPDRPKDTYAAVDRGPITTPPVERRAAISFDRSSDSGRRIGFSPSVSYAVDAYPVRRQATVEQVKASLRLVLAPQGITSEPIIHLMALDRVQRIFRSIIVWARRILREGVPDRALRILEGALNQLDPEHLPGRMAVLRALEKLSIEGRRFDRIQEWRDLLAEAEEQIMKLVIDAGREGGMSDAELQAALAALEQRDEQRSELGTASDFFSGRSFKGASAQFDLTDE